MAVQGPGTWGAARRIPLRVERPLSLGHQEVAEFLEEAQGCKPVTGGHITVHNRSAIAWNIAPAVSISTYAILASGSTHDFTAVATWRSLAATLA